MKKIALSTFFIMIVVGITQAQSYTSWNITGNSLPTISVDTYFLGTTNATPLRIRTNNQDRMYISKTGNVGIGTTKPHQMLHIVDGNLLISRTSTNRAPGSANGSLLFGDTATTANPAGEWGIEYVNDDNTRSGLNFWKPWNPNSNYGNYYLFLKDDGNVGIGTNNPQAKLAVNGEILAKSVRVNTNATYWPDYVFEDSYNLMSLRELERYVNAHKHLPGVPSAQEVEAKGDVDLGAMNALLLEKVEELTRYVIDLQNQIDELKKGKE